MAAATFEILRAPNKFDLMMSLFKGDSTERVSVTFIIQTDSNEEASAEELQVMIDEVIRGEDGSGEFWRFRGFSMDHKVRGWFRTDISTNTGRVTFEE